MNNEIICLDIDTKEVDQDRAHHQRYQMSNPDFLACLGNTQMRVLASPVLLTVVWQETLQVQNFRPQPQLKAWLEQWAEYRSHDDAPQPAGPAVILLHPDGTAHLKVEPALSVDKLIADIKAADEVVTHIAADRPEPEPETKPC